jgi:hypothetical protein
VAEALTAFLSIFDPLADRTEAALDDVFGVIAVLVEALRRLDVRSPSKLVPSDPATGAKKLYERSLA